MLDLLLAMISPTSDTFFYTLQSKVCILWFCGFWKAAHAKSSQRRRNNILFKTKFAKNRLDQKLRWSSDFKAGMIFRHFFPNFFQNWFWAHFRQFQRNYDKDWTWTQGEKVSTKNFFKCDCTLNERIHLPKRACLTSKGFSSDNS